MVDYVAAISNPNDAFMKARTYAEQLDQLANRRGAGALYAMGNRRGAAQALASGGDIQGAQAIEQNEATRLQTEHAYIQRAAPVLQQVYAKGGPQALLQAWDSLGPDLQRIGTSPDEIARYRQRIEANPDAALQMLVGVAQRPLKYVAAGDGRVYAIDEATGQYTVIGSPKPQMHVIPAGGRLAMTVPGSDTVTMPTQTPVPIAPSNPQPSGVTPSPPQGAGTPAQPSTGVPVPQPQPAPPRPQPQAIMRPPVATSPQGAAPGRGLPPPDAVALGLPNPEVNPQAFGPRTQIVAEGAPKPPAAGEQRWRPPTPEEAARYPGTSIQVNETTGEVRAVGRPGAQKLSSQEHTDLRNVRIAARDAQQMASDFQRLIDLNRGVETGPNLVWPIGSIRSMTDSNISEMNSIIERNVPRMRQGMPGAASDRDVQMFRAAGPSLTNPRAANTAIAQAAIAWAKRQQDYAAFIENWARQRNTLIGAQEAWNDYTSANPLFEVRGNNTVPRRVTPWRQWFANRGNVQSAPAQTPTPAGNPRIEELLRKYGQ